MPTIAVTGATGQLGRLTIAALKSRASAADVIALVRDPAKAADLGVATRAADYTRTDTLAAAFDGVDVLVMISSNSLDNRAGQHRNVIAAAKAARVGRIVYTSILKGDASPMVLARDHVETEAALKASGLPVTLLRNGWYTENVTGTLAGAIGGGAIIGCAGDGRISFAARADLAEAAAVAATDAGHAGKVYELAGDTAMTMADFAAEVARQLGKPLPYNSLPQDVYAGILTSFGLPADFAAMLADADAQAAQGALLDDSRALSTLIGRPTTPVDVTIRAALAAL